MKICPNCQTELLDKAKFCSSCGSDISKVTTQDSDLELLQKALSPKIIVEKKIDEGGMAGIYLGEQVSLKRKVVIKILLSGYSKDKSLADSFLEEAKIAANLKHNNIVEIIDFGEIKNRPFFIMEHGEKGSLFQEINTFKENNKKLPLRKSCEYIMDILHALTYSYDKHIKAHRDIKPKNILLRESGQAILSDFGISIREDQVPNKDEIVGSFPYMSPEQFDADPDLDKRSDIYSCGIMLYEMLTGELPFEGNNQEEWKYLHKNKEIPRLKTKFKKEDLAELESALIDVNQLQKIIDTATNKDKDKRYKNTLDMGLALKSLLKKKESFLNPENIKNRRIIYGFILLFVFISSASVYYFGKYFSTKTCTKCCFEGNCSDGIGKYRYSDLDVYEGHFKNDKPHGKGLFSFENHDVYKGDFSEGKIEGYGEYISADKNRYVGEFKNGKPNGRGTYYFPTGARYDGVFKDGQPSRGKGTYYTPEDDRYEGEQKDMIPHGKGILYYKNGDVYTGQFKNGNRHGFGTLVTKSGKKYEGSWVNDRLQRK